MAVLSKSRRAVERIIAWLRVGLAGASLLALWLDPAGFAWSAETGVHLNLAYLAYAVALLAISLARRHRPTAIVATHVIDVLASLALTYLSAGSSPFFVYLLFAMFCAALRWGWKGTLVTSSVIMVAYLGMTLSAGGSAGPSDFEVNKNIARIYYLLMAGAMLAYLCRHEERLRDEIERLSRWPTPVGSTVAQATEEIVAHAAQILGATRAVVVWESDDEPVARIASWSGAGLILDDRPSSAVSPLLPDALAESSLAIAEDMGAEASLVLRGPQGTFDEPRELSIPSDVLARLDGLDLVSAPFRTERISGRAFFAGMRGPGAELLPLTEVVAREIGSSLDQINLTHRLQEVAASEERIRVSRDLHDGVLQSLTGIRLELKSLADSLANRDDEVRARLVGLERALAIEQRELRFFIGGLKPAALPRPAADSLTVRLDALRERLALEWNTPVSIRVDPESEACPNPLAQAVPLMVHEAVVNALKHAQPTRVSVNVDGASDRLRIVVSDDGHGFPFKGQYDHRALGESRTAPKSLFDRVTALGGKMSIESSETGSRIEMVVSL